MGEERVRIADSAEQMQSFMKYVLKDLRALKRMLDEEWFETDPVRIGAEQELCLIDKNGKALNVAMQAMEKLNNADFTTELAQFNLEINLEPLEFRGSCLSDMENNLQNKVELVRNAVRELDGDILLTGILPTIRKSDVHLGNLTPLPRYRALCDAIDKLRGKEYELRIQGMDELRMKFDTPLLEGCNTGFQVHLQIKPDEFVHKYNTAQAVTAPVLAAAVNSPVLFGKRLWAETRIALFHQSVDTRAAEVHLRDTSPRVTFGNSWLPDSILDIYKEDISRYRVMLSSVVNEDVEDLLKNGIPPQLMALNVHNGTVYRWNRPCYGVAGNIAHLRIENRVLPAGPTVIDEVANAAFWLGLMNGLDEEYADITKELEFDNAKMNFIAASKMGLDTSLIWTKDRKVPVRELILQELLPVAAQGLKKADINTADSDTYLGIIRERVESSRTGSYWVVKSYGNLIKEGNREQTLSAIVHTMVRNQKKGEPVHKWGYARIEDSGSWRPDTLLVEEFMTTDLFTARRNDLTEFAAHLMEWRRIKYVPVEDEQKHLVGLISMRMIMRNYAEAIHEKTEIKQTIDEIMISNPVTIHPEASILEAMNIMQQQKIGCLPVVKNSRLVGIITEENFINISRRLIRTLAAGKDEN